MRKKYFLGLICLVVPMLWANGKFQPLNIKTGLWQMTSTRKTAGDFPMSPEMQARLTQMTPEQRARVQAYLKNMTSGMPKSRTYKSCLRQKDLNGNPFAEKNCKWSQLSSSGAKLDAEGTCASGDDNTTVHIVMHAVVLDSEHVKGTGSFAISNGDRTLKSDYVMNAKYLGSACGNTE